ncbi:uncharacterized acetyltransferase At3g50280-like [Papaver somniferum]|uniref:uncharacterized acetyltransferase At3g50280-like n=1 Tax=Papaver somniferum TaxID=3469 RepID=UPI000E7010FB|nr:uncharacterized acetyltransferase At3g50280-like [Papaver somniferum]
MNQETAKTVRKISKCTIKPHKVVEESKQQLYLTPWDLTMFNAHYIQKGLLFKRPSPSLEDPNPTETFIDQLKHSLSITLTHFYPLSGRLVTRQQQDPPFYAIYLDCSDDSVGAEFIHAAVDLNMMDILTPIYVPRIIQSFFALEGAINHDGHTEPLLVVQVTELLDGIFIGCSFNHVVGDGTAYWKFFNSFAEICRKLRKSIKEAGDYHHFDCSISHPPITKRLFLEAYQDTPLINLPFSDHKEFISRYQQPPLRERMFHFTAQSIAKLKAKANEECTVKDIQISSFQALSAFVWKSITRARNFPSNRKTKCTLAINNRLRLKPPLSDDYFGNNIHVVFGTTTSGELLKNGIGWAALLLHQAIKEHNNEKIRKSVDEWMKKPLIFQVADVIDASSVLMGSSPRFDMYGCDFGLGKAVAARSGYANKFDGKVSSYPGLTGTGSVMLEVCLPPESMSALESDEEFMDAVSAHDIHFVHLD